MRDEKWTPHVTVAVVVERANQFLLVEELAGGKPVLNQPAGHLEKNETLIAAAVRETLEETGWHIAIDYIVGIYQYTAPNNNVTYIRTCFAGTALEQAANAKLDQGIIGPRWLSYEQICALTPEYLRSPLVLRCIEDYRRNNRIPLERIVAV